jgi:biphenyl 2,3-dioxygenase subunit beta
MPSPALQFEVEQLYYKEALLLDRNQFHEWHGMFTPGAKYVVGASRIGAPESRPALEMAPVADDDTEFLSTRLARLDTGLVHATRPAARVRRLITNVTIVAERPNEVEVVSNFLLFQARQEDAERFFIGQREDLLRKTDDGWRIASRKVTLDHVLLPGLVTFFM